MQHLAMIMDGNRRWAREHKLETVMLGHRKGVDAIKASVRFCLNKEIKYLSLYTFSLENFKRSETEKTYLFNLLAETFRDTVDDLIKNGVRVRFVGDRSLFPVVTASVIDEIEEKTKHLEKLTLNMLFCYGSKQELVSATKKLAQKVQEGDLAVDQIDEEQLRAEFWLNEAPDPELIIRPGKVSRLSNFLLFHGAYSEWMFPDCYWPEMDEARLEACVDEFCDVQRNFGK